MATIMGIYYQSSFASMDALFTAVQNAAFAQGFSVRRGRTSRARRAGQVDATETPFNRIEICCKCAGRSTATKRKSFKLMTNCPFKAIGTLHKMMDDRWLLRVVDGTHNHAPDPDLIDNAKYRHWFRTRLGGAYELECLIQTARMAAVPHMSKQWPPQQPPPPQPQLPQQQQQPRQHLPPPHGYPPPHAPPPRHSALVYPLIPVEMEPDPDEEMVSSSSEGEEWNEEGDGDDGKRGDEDGDNDSEANDEDEEAEEGEE